MTGNTVEYFIWYRWYQSQRNGGGGGEERLIVPRTHNGMAWDEQQNSISCSSVLCCSPVIARNRGMVGYAYGPIQNRTGNTGIVLGTGLNLCLSNNPTMVDTHLIEYWKKKNYV